MLSSRIATRSFASAASPVKLTTRESSGKLSKLSVVINGGSKTGKSGLAHLLSRYQFQRNGAKSDLRFIREAELLGASFNAQVTRDAIVLNTVFFKQDLPYFVESLANNLKSGAFRPHYFDEIVLPTALNDAAVANSDNQFKALEKLHELAFRKGYGQPLYFDGKAAISNEEVVQSAKELFTTSNIEIVASGVDQADLTSFVSEFGFAQLPAGSPAASSQAFFQGESRIRASGQNVATIGVPVKTADFAAYEVLAATLGSVFLPSAVSPLGQIQGGVNASSQLYKYNDAGLFTITVSGANASAVAAGIKEAAKLAKAAPASNLKLAELAVALQKDQTLTGSVNVNVAGAEAAKLGKFSYVAVGNTDILPFADEL
ncbi:hypothetical protein BABINDRAFT_167129 [Babjeviella inositovora NRRL Y-12698]|uniref:Cytochrome b-c1 complex subunit 2, mitochondrial n=1 Tax=Babjeviella inositovora NRRL Y-12698 TaxID=984486 RepID=A0A1E3QSP1_9ASCO|nr:uncharacterized protein BABINDRAFT_167129 [Babjeviella inositovora NRRL Y-12698]ODQ80032.1 hypothetical protein BABINDRAFT_167129 [Babjeviella inositovora NRRL Y-12698]